MTRKQHAVGTMAVVITGVIIVIVAVIGYLLLTSVSPSITSTSSQTLQSSAAQTSPSPSCGSGNCVTSSSRSTILATAQTTLDGFNLTVTVGNTLPRIGDVVPIQIVLTDVSNSTAYPDGCSVDLIIVKNQTGSIVDGLRYEAITGTLTQSTSINGIGQNKIINQSWNVTSQDGFAPVKAGVYFIYISQCFTNDLGPVTTISVKPIQVQVSGMR